MSKRKSDMAMAKKKKKSKQIHEYEDNDTLKELAEQMQSALKNEVETYNRTKANLKGSYSKIQQLRGALDILLDLSENYELVPKT
jgi:hypothetical protein